MKTEQDEIQLVLFTLGSEEYAVPIDNVQEIIMPKSITKLPNTPEFIDGITNLRGHVISIIDGKKRFRMNNSNNEDSENTRIIILNTEYQTIGLIVDSVSEVIHLKTQNIDPLPVDMDSETEAFLGVGKYKEKLLVLINPNKFLTQTELLKLDKLKSVA